MAEQLLHGSQIATAGSVHFTELPYGRGTEVRVELKYDPPGGTLGSWLILGSAARRLIKIHRNKLAARKRHLDGLLGVDVSHSLAAQSANADHLMQHRDRDRRGIGPDALASPGQLTTHPPAQLADETHPPR